MIAATVLFATLAATVGASPLVPRAPTTVQIHPQGNTKLCLTAPADYRNHGVSAVTIQNCDCSNALQNWLVNAGKTMIAVASDPGYCVSGGVNALRGWFPADGKRLEIWQCAGNLNDGFTTWNYFCGSFHTTGVDSQIPPQPADHFCMDNSNGNLAPGNTVQYWTCVDGNTNQQWVTTPKV